MDRLDEFFGLIDGSMIMNLATAGNEGVTMRAVSPVSYEGAVLIFTAASSKKYRQLKENPHCCMGVGSYYAQAIAEFCGKTMSQENEALRNAYSAKFPGAFDEGVEFGGRNAEFVLLRPVALSGWTYQEGMPKEGIPTMPFDITL